MDEGNFRGENELDDETLTSIIHIRVQQRSGRKNITIIEGIPTEFDFPKILRAWKKIFNCTGTTVKEEDKEIFQLTGDQRQNIAKFLVEEGIAKRENIKIHGA